MTTRVVAKDLLNAVKVGGASWRRRSHLPVLAGMLIRRNSNKVEVISTDLDTVSRDSAPVANAYGPDGHFIDSEDFAVVVPQKVVKDWIRALEPVKTKKEATMLEVEYRHDPITQPVKGGYVYTGLHAENLIIRCGNYRATFYGISAEEFPLLDNRIPAEGKLDHYKLPE